MQVQEQVSLKPYNTFGIDVVARYFAHVSVVEQLQQLLEDRKYAAVPVLVLGGGSNVLFTGNYNGLVIRNELKGIVKEREDADFVFVKAGAGEVWHEFVMYCIAHNYGGLENLSLIPGCVGAAPMQNIGAYGVEMKDTFYSLEALNTETFEVETFFHSQCEFGYRESVFKRRLKGAYIILNVTFRLSKNPVFQTTYGAIQQELDKMGVSQLSIRAISDAVIAIRKSKLPDPAQIGNAGSFFKNPEVTAQERNALLKEFPDAVSYELPNGNYKLAAGWLIEKAGWKGKTLDNYGVHKNQALVLVNYGGAQGKQIFDLSTAILSDIEAKFKVHLEREVNII